MGCGIDAVSVRRPFAESPTGAMGFAVTVSVADGAAEVASDDESESRCDTTAQAPTPAAAATARTAPTLKRERRGALCGASVASGCGSCWPMTQGTAVIWPEDTSCRACASDGSKTSTS